MNLFLSEFLPQILRRQLHTIRNRLYPSYGNYLSGNYLSWSDALQASIGYDSDNILKKTKDALLKVKNGELL